MSTVGTLKKLLAHFDDDLPLQIYIDNEYEDFDPNRSHWFHDVDYSKEEKPLTLKLGSGVSYELHECYHLPL